MSGPLVSVVMATFNAKVTLGSAIMSLISQRYWNWELILVDDGSTDGTADLVKDFDEKRIKFFRMAQNVGLAAALNQGIALASSRYIARMDADDMMEDWRLFDQMRRFLSEDLVVIGSGADKFGSETGYIGSPCEPIDIYNTMLVNNPFVHPTVLYDRSKLGKALYYKPDFVCEEDYELWSRVIGPSNGRNLDYSTLRYRVSATSNANNPFKKRLTGMVLAQFSRRIGLSAHVPVETLAEFQLSGFIDEGGYKRLRRYAEQAPGYGWPTLGWLQTPLLEWSSFGSFFKWLHDIREMTPYKLSSVA